MATYPIFIQEGGQRIAINPDSVTSIIEIERGRVAINLPDGGSATISMPLEDVVGRLSSGRELAPWGERPSGRPIRLAPRLVVEWRWARQRDFRSPSDTRRLILVEGYKPTQIEMNDAQYAWYANLCSANRKDFNKVPIVFTDAPQHI
jgi:hypothetical protein